MTSSDNAFDITENLVAYLDGELTDEEAEAVARAISADPKLRRRVAALKHTWQMLDTLPEPRATGAFTQQTMDTVQFVSQTQSQLKSDWRSRWQFLAQRTAFVLGITLSAALGFLLTNRWTDDHALLLLHDYSVIRRLDGLTEIGSKEFLQELDKNGLFDDSP